jgi:hypothetical protein
LNKYIDCRVHYKNGRVIDCLQIYGLVEIFDGLNLFGKCFTYLNENEKNDENITKEFMITKEDYIELSVNYDNITDIVGNHYVIPVLYLGIDSPKNSIVNGDYLLLALNWDYFKIDFSKTTFKALEWPYSTDCHHYNYREYEYISRDNCLEYCHLYQQISLNGCLKDPSNKSQFSVSNRRTNSKLRHIKICETHNKYSALHKCQKLCKRDCDQHYYQFDFNHEKRKIYKNRFFVRFNSENLPIFEYRAIPKYSFVVYMTGIGGLMSLWLGISALDLKAIFEFLIIILQKITTKVMSICSLNEFFYRFIQKFAFYLEILKKIDFKKLMTILSCICFTYQLIELTIEFTAFKTTIYVDLNFTNFYENNWKNPSYYSNTFCIENSDLLVEFTESQTNIINQNESRKSELEFYAKMENISDKENNISKFLSLAKSKMPSFMRCLRNKFGNDNCIDRKYILMSFSNLGECYTYGSYLSFSSDEELFDKMYHDRYILIGIFIKLVYRMKKFKRLIHDPYQLPSLAFTAFLNERKQNYDIFTFKFERLPPPYDSNCYDYKESKSFRSRGHCINDCLINEILMKYNCIPRDSLNILTFYDNLTINSSFCYNNIHKNLSEKECSDKCPKPCEELVFIANPIGHHHSKEDYGDHIAYINNVNMTFIYFITSIGGLLGLWNNISIYHLQLILMKISTKIINSKVMKKLWMLLNSTKISKLLKWIRIFVTKFNFKVNFSLIL